jgi:NADH dehydrogenase
VKVLVTGGTGFVGREILARLDGSGHAVRLLVRQPESVTTSGLARRHRAEVCQGDILEPASLGAAMEGVDAVIHLVGIISEFRANTFERVHIQGTANVVGAARKAGVRRFIHMSALGTRPDAVARYHQSKWIAEEIVRAGGMNWTIFRPSIIYGPGDGFVNLFARMARVSPIMPLIGGGRAKMQPIPVGEVATAFVKALTEPRAVGQMFDLGGGEVLTLEEIVDAVMAATGRRRFKVRVPLFVARCQAAVLEAVFPALLHRPAPLNRDQLLMLREDNTGHAAPANELFGLRTVPFREGIAAAQVSMP